MKLLFFDLETTGVNFWQHGIHQLSGIIEVDGKFQKDFDFKVRPNPKAKIEKEALDVAGVTLDQIQAYPPMETVYKEFVSMLSEFVDKYNKKDKFYLVGYNNASFDNQFLRAFFIQNNDNYFGSWFWSNSIDCMVMATPKLAEVRSQMSDFKLKTVAKQLGIEVDESMLHNAMYDIHLTQCIYEKCK